MPDPDGKAPSLACCAGEQRGGKGVRRMDAAAMHHAARLVTMVFLEGDGQWTK
jgi:hypothetical protein